MGDEFLAMTIEIANAHANISLNLESVRDLLLRGTCTASGFFSPRRFPRLVCFDRAMMSTTVRYFPSHTYIISIFSHHSPENKCQYK